MTCYILDSNVIFAHPQILDGANFDEKIIIPRVVMEELTSMSIGNPRFHYLLNAIRGAVNRASVEVEKTDVIHPEIYGLPNSNLGRHNALVLSSALIARDSGKETVLATDDKKLSYHASKHYKLNVINSDDLDDKIFGNKHADGTANKADKVEYAVSRKKHTGKTANISDKNDNVSKYEKARKRATIVLVSVSVGMNILFLIGIQNAQSILDTVLYSIITYPNWFLTLIAPLVAFIMHSWKKTSSFTYGIAEILAGALACYVISLAYVDPTKSLDPLAIAVGYAAGLFTIVRGAGNMHDGLNTFVDRPRMKSFFSWFLDPVKSYRDYRAGRKKN